MVLTYPFFFHFTKFQFSFSSLLSLPRGQELACGFPILSISFLTSPGSGYTYIYIFFVPSAKKLEEAIYLAPVPLQSKVVKPMERTDELNYAYAYLWVLNNLRFAILNIYDLPQIKSHAKPLC